MQDALASALAAGATVVTPNRRLARHLVDDYDRAQRAAGRVAWPSARVLPWPAWIGLLDAEAVAAAASPPLARLSPHATAELWRGIVEADGVATPDPDSLADAAERAWTLVHAFGTGSESWRAWDGGDDEPAAFARWAKRYRDRLADLRATDAALMPDRVARAAASMPAWRDRAVVLAGFVERTPAELRVVEALRAAGMAVTAIDPLGEAKAAPRSASFDTPADELAAAFGWARRRLEADADARIGIVVPDLATRLAEVRRAAREHLGDADGDARAPAWNVSLGAPLAEVPVVATAIDLLALAWSTLPAGRAAALMRSRYLPDDDDRGRATRAGLERDWLERGLRRVRLDDVIADLERRGDRLASRLATLRQAVRAVRNAPRRAWIDAWRDALRLAGWPGRALGSDEHQASAALDELFASLASLDAIGDAPHGTRIGGADAAASLARWAASTPFQPESPGAPIQIVGLIESIGLSFDALWIAGTGDDQWPRPPRPNALLPIRWQRERGVPRSDAAGELAWARDVTSTWLRAAHEVVASRAPTAEQRIVVPSPLFAAVETALPVPVSQARAMFDMHVARLPLPDGRAPPLAADEPHRATAATIDAQSACPFKALAAMRWRVEPWPVVSIGLTPAERGTLVHAALEAVFADVRDSGALAALVADRAALARAVTAAAEHAIRRKKPPRWNELPDAVRAGEAARIARQVAQWLVEVEARRPPFCVVATEQDFTFSLGPLALRLRLDRVDALDGGGVAIVDYKTGEATPFARWTADRPEATQLALYSLAWRAAHPDRPVRATALGQLRPNDCDIVGAFADDAARFDATSKRQVVPDDWAAFEAVRDDRVRALGRAFVDGEAQVAPRRLDECRTCRRHALCRIGEAEADAGDET